MPRNKPPTPAGTRDRLVEAARHLFGRVHRHGPVRHPRAGANSGSFYHFFESKDALLRTVLETYADAIEPMLLAPVLRLWVRRPLDLVTLLLGSYRERLAQTACAYGCPIGRLALEIDAPKNTPTSVPIARNFDRWTAAVADAVRLEGIADADDVATFVLAVMEGAVMQSRAHRSLAPYDAALRQMTRYLASLPRGTSARRSAPRRARKVSRR